MGLALTAIAGAALFVACGGNGNRTPPDPCAPNGRQVGEQCMCDPGFIPLGLNCLPIGSGGGGGGGNDGGQNNPDGGVTDPDGGMNDPDGGMTDPDGGTDAGYVCGPSNCDTCCVNNTCVSVSNNLTCGSGGNTCQTCSGSQQCNAGVCQTASTCGPGNCSGCCQGNTCVTGNTASACGTGGGVCTSCSGGQTCQSGVCTSTSANCGVVPSFGSTTVSNQAAIHSTFPDGGTGLIEFFGSLNSDAHPDELVLELWHGYGAFQNGYTPNTISLTNEELDIETCGACVFVYANVDPSTLAAQYIYMATGGTLTLNSVSGVPGSTLSGTLQNATFQKVATVLPDAGYEVTQDGCATSIGFASFSTTLQ